MIGRLREDVRAMRERDPAARSTLAVVLTYAGLHARWSHRVASLLWDADLHLPARLVAHLGRSMTGVEIHPAAEIGRRVTIDHGMGVVIGETAEVGDDVHMYHGVTLGGDDPRPVKRHPTVRSGAVLGANATILGAIEVGEDANVGAGAVVTDDVPPGATAVGVPAEIHGTEPSEEGQEGAGSSTDDGREVDPSDADDAERTGVDRTGREDVGREDAGRKDDGREPIESQ